jgi:hypothetical protein
MSEYGGVGKWIAGIIATIISGVAVFYLTEGRKQEPSTPVQIAPLVPKSPEASNSPPSEPEPSTPTRSDSPVTESPEASDSPSSEPELPTPPQTDSPITGSPGDSAPLPSEPEPSQVSDISGIWKGELYQQRPNGTTETFLYTLDLTQDGNSVYGAAKLEVPPPYGYYIVMKIRGTLSGDTLDFDDGPGIEMGSPPGWFWCQKSVSLNRDGSALQGTWSASGCIGGEVSLSRY